MERPLAGGPRARERSVAPRGAPRSPHELGRRTWRARRGAARGAPGAPEMRPANHTGRLFIDAWSLSGLSGWNEARERRRVMEIGFRSAIEAFHQINARYGLSERIHI